jgi:hypothetical protein
VNIDPVQYSSMRVTCYRILYRARLYNTGQGSSGAAAVPIKEARKQQQMRFEILITNMQTLLMKPRFISSTKERAGRQA